MHPHGHRRALGPPVHPHGHRRAPWVLTIGRTEHRRLRRTQQGRRPRAAALLGCGHHGVGTGRPRHVSVRVSVGARGAEVVRFECRVVDESEAREGSVEGAEVCVPHVWRHDGQHGGELQVELEEEQVGEKGGQKGGSK